MKGQNQIINEVLLFAIGMSIAAAVIINFQTVQRTSSETTIYSNFENVANTVINGITEVVKGERGKVVVAIPDTIASIQYKIKVSSDYLIISSINDPKINITKRLFNISSSHIIQGEVPSAARYIEITYETTPFTKLVRIRRAEKYV